MIVKCPECDKHFQLPDEKAGIKFRCSQCQTVVDSNVHLVGDNASESTRKKAVSAPTDEKQHYLISAKGHILLPKDREFIFGRALQSDYLLDDPKASRKHSNLRWNGAAFLLSDLGSRNGTFYKGEPLSDVAPLQDGDHFQIANESFEYRVVKDFEELRKDMRDSRRFNRMQDTEELEAIDSVLPPNDFNGSLNTMGTTEICQILKLGRRTGRLFIMDDSHQKCLLYFDEGNIVSAEYRHEKGDQAVLDACQIHSGVFSFQSRFRATQPNVLKNTEFLLLEAARKNDEET